MNLDFTNSNLNTPGLNTPQLTAPGGSTNFSNSFQVDPQAFALKSSTGVDTAFSNSWGNVLDSIKTPQNNGNWFSNLFGGGKGNGIFSEDSSVLPTIQTLGALTSAYSGWKNSKTAAKTLNFQKNFAQKQLDNSSQSYNNQFLSQLRNQQNFNPDSFSKAYGGLTPAEVVAQQGMKS